MLTVMCKTINKPEILNDRFNVAKGQQEKIMFQMERHLTV
jgi:hypothetical protein